MKKLLSWSLSLLFSGACIVQAEDSLRVLPHFKNHEVLLVKELKDFQGGNLSGITYNFDTGTYFLMQNNYETLFEYDRNFEQLRVIKMLNLEDDDTEDIVYLGDNKFALSSETNKVIIFTLKPGQTTVDLNAARADVQLFQLPRPGEKNQGLEGVCYTSRNTMGGGGRGRFYAVQQNRPRKVYTFVWPNNDEDVRNYRYLGIQEPFDTYNLFKHRMSDLSGCTFSDATNTLLVLSHASSRIMEFSVDGKTVDTLDLPKVAPQYEGITFSPEGDLVLVSEPNIVVVLRGKTADSE
ncbi:MAG: SdiA-regulated domain-containing protein [Bdellovibrio sp.]